MFSLRILFIVALMGLVGCRGPRVAETNYLEPERYGRVVRVACVGDSITFGAGVENRDRNHYPAVLGKCLGERFETRNFGVSGATLLKAGDYPYWKQKAFEEALAYQPDVVVIKLGTNDSKPQNWKHKDQFEADLQAMIEQFRRVKTRPRIWVCLPVPVYQDRWGINEAAVRDEVIPAIRRVAARKGVPTIDLHAAMSNRPEWFPDGVHPNAVGAANLAQVICYTLLEHP
jgi:acyl-CoA thioesterase I